jgi:hypothetical protein
MSRLGVISALLILVSWTAVAFSNAEPLRIGDPAPSPHTRAMGSGRLNGCGSGVLSSHCPRVLGSYGNVEHHPPLSHGKISFAFGRTRFVQDWVRPNREGLGLFPDIWLDTESPVELIARIAGAPQCSMKTNTHY